VKAEGPTNSSCCTCWSDFCTACRNRRTETGCCRILADWETEHGKLTVDEIARAEAELGLRASDAA
jgi:hypothetical protein